MTSPRALFLFLALSCATIAAHADAVRPGAAASLSLRTPSPHPVFRGDNQRTGRTAGFPSTLSPLWKFQIKGGIDLPAVAAAGFVEIASSSGHLVRLDLATGKERQRVALPAAPLQGPVITARGDRVITTIAGDCLGYTPAGELRFRRPLPARPQQLRVAPIVPASGGVILAAGPNLLRLDGEGRTQDSAKLPEPPTGALVETPQGVIAVSTSGRVYRWQSPDPPINLGSLSGNLTSLPAVANRALVASVDGNRLIFFDLVAGMPGVSVSSLAAFEGAPSVGTEGEVWMMTSAGLLLAISPEGRELERASVLGGTGADLGTTGNAMLVAEGGKVAFFRPSGELVVWSKQGEISSDQRACNDPIGLLSDGERLVITCRDGTVAAFGAPAAKP